MKDNRTTLNDEELKTKIKQYIDHAGTNNLEAKEIWNRYEHEASKKDFKGLRAMEKIASVILCILLAGGLTTGILLNNQNKKQNEQPAETTAISGQSAENTFDTAFFAEYGIEQKSLEIIMEVLLNTDFIYSDLQVWSCNEDELIFAGAQGAIIYDRKNSKISATIDLQGIGCHYINCENWVTKAYTENGKLYIFNEKNNSATGSCYVFQLGAYDTTGIRCLQPESITDADKKNSEKWSELCEPHLEETFHFLTNSSADQFLMNQDYISYTKNLLGWTDSNNQTKKSFLIQEINTTATENVFDQVYLELYTKTTGVSECLRERLNITVSEKALEQYYKMSALPEYVYTGEDETVRLISDYLLHENNTFQTDTEEGNVYIPNIFICKDVKKDGIRKVYTVLQQYDYYRTGNILCSDSGGISIVCFHLKEENGVWHVDNMIESLDGAFLRESVVEMCDNDEALAEELFDIEADAEAKAEVRVADLTRYVTENELDIKYLYDFGWDYVDISGSN